MRDELEHQQEVWERRLKSGHGAYDGKSRTGKPAGIIMLAGPIKHWWDDNWMTPEHLRYVEWRDKVTDALVADGYLVYQPHAAFKGTWNEAAQVVNNSIIEICDAVVILTPPGVPSDGTNAEVKYASNLDKPHINEPPPPDPYNDTGCLKYMLARLSSAILSS